MRFLFALWVGKLARVAMRALGRNATYLPGVIAIKICPQFLKHVGKPKTFVSITGTNGKTTTVNLVCDVLESSGQRVLSNRYGTNVAAGIAATLLHGNSLTGRCKYDIGVFEADERSVKRIYPSVPPTHLVITNLFRDSIARNAHPQYIADFLTDAIPAQTKLILNADDPILSRVAPSNPRVYFGIEKQPSDIIDCINLINDLRICPICSGELTYQYRRYHHIGKFRCADCDFNAPEYDYSAENINLDAMTMNVYDRHLSDENAKHGKHSEHGSYKLLSDSIFNIYNMLTAISLLRELGMTHEKISENINKLNIVGSRYNEHKVGDIKIIMQMAKQRNALAVSRAFDYISSQPGEKQILLMMNCQTDGKHWSENPCWMYDCDFEFLNKPNIKRIVASGFRSKDLYLRLLFADIPEERLLCVRDEFEAAKGFDFSKASNIYILYGTDSYSLATKVKSKIIEYAENSMNIGKGAK